MLRRKDGSTFVVSPHSFVRFDDNGEMDGVEGIARDITDRKKAEQRTLDAKMEAEEASMAKTRFLGAASHDLRQPLQAINLYLAVLSAKANDAATADVIHHIENSVGALNNLLESLLDISRLEAGMVKAEAEMVALDEVLQRLGGEFAQACQDKGLAISVVPTSLVVRADPVLLENILRNLLANAVKYTNRGKILLGCRRCQGWCVIEIWDTGIGISESQLSHVFEEFYQIENHGRNRHMGLGLGLSIVDKMAKVLGGKVAARSWPGRGSVFSLSVEALQKSPPGAIAALEADAQQGGGRSIIVIDDEPAILAGLAMFLESQGHRVQALCCGTCERCRATIAAMAQAPDLIVADYRLQEGRTGVEAVADLRAKFKQPLPAIILTGDTAPGRLAEVMSSGLPIMHKPIEANALQAEILKILDQSEASPA